MSRTVLIVDDSAPFPATARGLLEARGYRVVGVSGDGAGALAAARTLRPDEMIAPMRVVIGEVRARQPDVGVLVLSQHAEERYALD